ncbi:DUF3900 domain-containing protein [Bacillus solimangrovi]|uniref:DUF3898 domain-containing protein n=1 Tax=Bacillus solimangrovi TaxID=1305675 RepID=A0A1E5LF20_9BACI|nr:DUF3900 domain-containing protein [Bacillus solimangrovi]OEH92670.1 hypothetical protein BFG57_01300 [Bacillus solimangrovi]
MDFEIEYLSFFVVEVNKNKEQTDKSYKHFQTLNSETYENSALKGFLDGELMKISKRKVERHPKSTQAPTKIGRFIIEPGYGYDSNPNFNLFNRLRKVTDEPSFQDASNEFVRAYVETSAVRGGALITARAKLSKYFDEPFVFLLKCDFEPKVASITDENSLIHHVEMAITTKNMKSIQYPYMPEEGIIEEGELKIHQSSHANYFEDFLKFVQYEDAMPDIMKNQVMEMVQQHIEQTYEPESQERLSFQNEIEVWEASAEREIREHLTPDQVTEATSQIIEHSPEVDLKMKIDHISIKGLLSDFAEQIHVAKVNDRYVVLIEGDSISFDKQGFSPVEFLRPDELHEVVEKVIKKNQY